jgi:DNA/RNA-binding domain of Phe-tRNA-synthetase-like protein
MLTFRIHPDTDAGDLQAFLLVWTLTNPKALNASAVAEGLRQACEAVVADGPAKAAIEAYKTALMRLGRNPNRYRISSDALARRCRRDGTVPTILPLVDLNNTLSLRTGWPIGCYDMAKVEGEAVFRLGRVGELMSTLGKGDMDVSKLPLLSDAAGPFGSTISDSVRTSVGEATGDPCFVMYGYGPANAARLASLVTDACQVAGGIFDQEPVEIRT